jgi:hypothetical protein
VSLTRFLEEGLRLRLENDGTVGVQLRLWVEVFDHEGYSLGRYSPQMATMTLLPGGSGERLGNVIKATLRLGNRRLIDLVEARLGGKRQLVPDPARRDAVVSRGVWPRLTTTSPAIGSGESP